MAGLGACVHVCSLMTAGHYRQKERTAGELSEQERAALLQAAESCALPDGVFFNGSKYVNWDGETLKEHPCLPQVIDDFLEKERLGDALCPLPAPTASILCLFHSPLLLRFEASLGSASCVTPGLFCRARCAALAHG
jgi:hypothetical protein